MADQDGRKDYFALGTGLLAAAVYLCVQGLRKVEERLEEKTKK